MKVGLLNGKGMLEGGACVVQMRRSCSNAEIIFEDAVVLYYDPYVKSIDECTDVACTNEMYRFLDGCMCGCADGCMQVCIDR
ncbi:hypothetical protein HNR77_000748 [Paenibacillus sp. JGP012]|nr:hypothetical protein [Paenibacillus sp. JGP012]